MSVGLSRGEGNITALSRSTAEMVMAEPCFSAQQERISDLTALYQMNCFTAVSKKKKRLKTKYPVQYLEIRKM
jgi:hypothetical protein